MILDKKNNIIMRKISFSLVISVIFRIFATKYDKY